jgi:hypothetical protein
MLVEEAGGRQTTPLQAPCTLCLTCSTLPPQANQEAKAKIQKDIQEVPELRFAVLSLNHLTGTLPPSWVTVPQNLHTLTLANNDFNGPLPDEWDLPQLAWLDLAGNLFEGGWRAVGTERGSTCWGPRRDIWHVCPAGMCPGAQLKSAALACT